MAAAVALLGVIVVGGLMLRSPSTDGTSTDPSAVADASAAAQPAAGGTELPLAMETPLDGGTRGSSAGTALPLPVHAGRPGVWAQGLLAGPEDLTVVNGDLLVLDQVDRRVYRGAPDELEPAIGSGQPGPIDDSATRAGAVNLELPVAVAAADGRIALADRRQLWLVEDDDAQPLAAVEFDPTAIALAADGTVVVAGARSATGRPGPLLRIDGRASAPIAAAGIQDPRALVALGDRVLVLDSGTVPTDGRLAPNVLWSLDVTTGATQVVLGGGVLTEPIAMALAGDGEEGRTLAILQEEPALGTDAQGRPDPQVVIGFSYSLHLVEIDAGGAAAGPGRTVPLGSEVLRPRAITWLGSEIVVADRGQGRLLTYDGDGTYVGGGDADAYPCANDGSAGDMRLRGPVRVSRGADGVSVVADSATGCVYTIAASGRVTGDLQINLGLRSIQGVAVTEDGRVFISDGGTQGSGQVIEVTGGRLARIAGTGTDPAALAAGERLDDEEARTATDVLLDGPTALAAHDGVLYVLDGQEQVIAVTLSDLLARRAVTAAQLAAVDAQTLADIDATEDGLYLASLTQGRLFRATWPAGQARFGPGATLDVVATALGQPQAVALQPDGTALVIDRGGSAVVALPDGRPRSVFGAGSSTVPDGAPSDVAVSDDGTLLVVDQVARVIWRSP